MKEAIVHSGEGGSIDIEVVEHDLPVPKSDQVLIKVVVTGFNPKDWKVPVWMPDENHKNTGDDIAGIVHSVGDQVTDFKPGDRVAAFHEMRTPNGSFAEYAIAQEHTTFHIPAKTTFEEAATIPLAAMTAAIGLFCRLGLPEPWNNEQTARSSTAIGDAIVVYGAATAVGAYAIKLLAKSNIHPIIAIAGNGIPFVESLLDPSKGDTIIDYRQGDAHVTQSIKQTLGPNKTLKFAFDAVSDHNSWLNVGNAMPKNAGAKITHVLFDKEYDGVEVEPTRVGSAHESDRDFAYAWFRLFTLGLKDGWFAGHPYEVVDGGLSGGVKKALENLRDGKASAVKYVVRIDEAEAEKGGKK